MIYNDFKGDRLSALGLGCMRLPTKETYENIDIEKTREMVDIAIKSGINYFDTAWGYHSGNSETVMGEVLSHYPRESFRLASKFPGYDLANFDKAPEIFEKQLEKCRVEYFDFYLFHSLTDKNIEAYLDRSNGVYDYLVKEKRAGRIRNLGVSVHSSLEDLKRFLDAYGAEMDFCQIQLNWLDWEYQDAKAKVELLNSLNIPIWVMEPVRGGRLCSLAPKYEKMLMAQDKDRTMPEWAFRYLQSIDGVTMVLSGMSNREQLESNIKVYEERKPLNDKEMQTLADISYEMTHSPSVPCTACRYCTEKCPMELSIPEIIEIYNQNTYTDGGFIDPERVRSLPEGKLPNACVGCRACEAVCPQSIRISEIMSDFADRLK